MGGVLAESALSDNNSAFIRYNSIGIFDAKTDVLQARDDKLTFQLSTGAVGSHIDILYSSLAAAEDDELSTTAVNDLSLKSYYGWLGGDWSECIRELGKELHVTVVDQTAATLALYKKLGFAEASRLHTMKTDEAKSLDKTHLNQYGAARIAYLVATQLSKKDKRFASFCIKKPAEPTAALREINPNYKAAALPGSSAGGAVYYLSPDGDDANAGTSPEKQFATLRAAQDVVQAGDTVYIRGGGGNVDGFGFQPNGMGQEGNMFVGCRAWWNSDDGFDESGTGYGGLEFAYNTSAENGAGFRNEPKQDEYDTTTVSRSNYNLPSRRQLAEVDRKLTDPVTGRSLIDYDGENYTLTANVSYAGGAYETGYFNPSDGTKKRLSANTFQDAAHPLTAADFVSTDAQELFAPRTQDGSLPDIRYLQFAPASWWGKRAALRLPHTVTG